MAFFMCAKKGKKKDKLIDDRDKLDSIIGKIVTDICTSGNFMMSSKIFHD